jgi:hypothetical protein
LTALATSPGLAEASKSTAVQIEEERRRLIDMALADPKPLAEVIAALIQSSAGPTTAEAGETT